jgi:hypothetical protein
LTVASTSSSSSDSGIINSESTEKYFGRRMLMIWAGPN